MLLIPNIINYRVKISLAYGTDKVTIRPKAICPDSLWTIGVQFFQFLAGSTFDQLHHFGGRIRRLAGQNQMHMIRLDIDFHNFKLVYLRTKTNHPFQPLFDSSYQLPPSVFGNKGKVIGDIIGGMAREFDHALSSLSNHQPSFLCLKDYIPPRPKRPEVSCNDV